MIRGWVADVFPRGWRVEKKNEISLEFGNGLGSGGQCAASIVSVAGVATLQGWLCPVAGIWCVLGGWV